MLDPPSPIDYSSPVPPALEDLARLSSAELAEVFRCGAPPPLEDLAGWEFSGWNTFGTWIFAGWFLLQRRREIETGR